ncbi:hypothetical protein TNCV_2134891 [Trichonephila clavipes]|nr:hypothetical protein TNCV_2134891 [Trichonephila clavipes]
MLAKLSVVCRRSGFQEEESCHNGGYREYVGAKSRAAASASKHPAFALFVMLTITMKIKDRNGFSVIALVHPGSMRNVSSYRVDSSIVLSVVYKIRKAQSGTQGVKIEMFCSFLQTFWVSSMWIQKPLSLAGSKGRTSGSAERAAPNAKSITPFISTRAPLKYCRSLSSDITPTTDGCEKTNGWIPHLRAGTSSETRDVKKHCPYPQESGQTIRLKHSKKKAQSRNQLKETVSGFGSVERKLGQGRTRTKMAREYRHLSIITRCNKDTTASQLTCEVYAVRETRISRVTVSESPHKRV